MNYPLPNQLARNECLKLKEGLEPKFNNHMIGILICKNNKNQIKIIKAFSGQINGLYSQLGWAPPCFDETKFNLIAKSYDLLIKDKNCTNNKAVSKEAQEKIFDLYEFTCIDKTIIKIKDVFFNKLPPTGTGDCCEPKLLNQAFSLGLIPLSMDEFYFGENVDLKIKGEFYPPCDQKCRPLLAHMLKLDIVYIDKYIIVVNKPHGLLSVPGRTPENQDCITSRVKTLFPDCINQPSVHRLDQDTSGLMVLAFDKESHKNLSKQFIAKTIFKQYVALVEGKVLKKSGTIKLKFRLDTENRPHQIYDEEMGKIGITNFERLKIFKYEGKPVTKVLFTPLTGRTHQIRLHSSHQKGLASPIVGDRLYGNKGEKLMLQAKLLEFNHPFTKERLSFQLEDEF